MDIWNSLSKQFRHNTEKYKMLFLPSHRVDLDKIAAPINPGEAYYRLWLVEMRLARSIDWFTKRYPVVHASIRFNYGGQPVTIPYFAGPGYFQQFTEKNLDRIIRYNDPLTPLFPFSLNKDTIKLQAGLFSMIASDPIGNFITTVERVSKLLPVPELSTVIKLAGPIYKSIEDLMNAGDYQLALGYEYTFSAVGGGGSNTLRPGYFAVIFAEENKFDDDELCVVNDSLRLGTRGNAGEFLRQSHRSLDGHSYMLFRWEMRREQDWESLTDIKVLVNQAQDADFKGEYSLVKDVLLPTIQSAIYRSNDLTKHDKKEMVLKIESELDELGLPTSAIYRSYGISKHDKKEMVLKIEVEPNELGLQITEREVPKLSLNSIMQQPLFTKSSETEARLVALERITEIERTLRRIRLMAEEGQEEYVLEQLETIFTEDPQMQQEITYTRAWYYTQTRQWKEALQHLSLLYDPKFIEENWDDAMHTERERRAFYLVWLGTTAVNLSRYDDASRQFTRGLEILELQRVHLPKLRIKALCGQAMTCIIAGLNAVAIQHYQEALKVCAKEKLQQELKRDIADIHYGLADAYRQTGDFNHARTYGRMALQMYEDLADRYFVCRVYNLLGRIAFQLGEYQAAAELYMESLSLAVLEDKMGMKMIGFVAMADVRLAELRLDEAQRYCDHALELTTSMQEDHHLCGMLYLVCGKVAFAKAKQAQGEETYNLLQEAQHIYQKAEEHLRQTQATAHLSELYGRCAEVCEALNQPQEALAYWKSAFNTGTALKGAGWYD